MEPDLRTDRELSTGDLYVPKLQFGHQLVHYYGDHVRKLFVGSAALMLILAPFWGDFLAFTLPIELLGALALITLAALTHPKKELVMLANTIAAGVGVAMNEIIALVAYSAGNTLIFMGREILAFLFAFALYFALKTLRAMWLGQVGRREPPGEMRETTLEEKWDETHKLM